MKSVVILVTASLMLVGATIAATIANTVHANPNFEWCQDFVGGLQTY